MVESELDTEKREKNKEKPEKIRTKYKIITEQHGAEIKGVYYISRDEQFPSLYENADFSIDTVKASIKQAELKTNHILKNIKMR
jgi:NTE family protein